MQSKLLYLFTRTPLHMSAGASAGAIDQPILRERHTGFPIVPGTSLKGVFAEQWTERITAKDPDGKTATATQRQAEGNWLFGVGAGKETPAAPGALQFSEAKLLAFPVRSARGGFGWITCPLILRRFARDGGMKGFLENGGLDYDLLPKIEPREDQALFAKSGPLVLNEKVVLEEYTFNYAGELPGRAAPASSLAGQLQAILTRDPVWSEIANRLVIVNDGTLNYFSQTACEVIQRIAINAASGLTQPHSLFSQENIPSETMFYACLNCFDDRNQHQPRGQSSRACEVFASKLASRGHLFQFGADASTGLGCCTVELRDSIQ